MSFRQLEDLFTIRLEVILPPEKQSIPTTFHFKVNKGRNSLKRVCRKLSSRSDSFVRRHVYSDLKLVRSLRFVNVRSSDMFLYFNISISLKLTDLKHTQLR